MTSCFADFVAKNRVSALGEDFCADNCREQGKVKREEKCVFFGAVKKEERR